ncbi:uncharacterized protein LOC110685159 [Chenopodium quinoa]|uniref:uncharacterized protein LOC110685159 n=1 Tax=Chenopodium quinoa TaxID=63459 RepID=UPI000B797521|nr:uncharacterized protein LOC110685159 [Chenopodium quinoa]
MEGAEKVALAIEKYEDFCRVHDRILEVLKLGAIEMKKDVLRKRDEVDLVLKDAGEGVQSAIDEAPIVVVAFGGFLNRLKRVADEGAAQLKRLREDEQMEREKIDLVLLEYNK